MLTWCNWLINSYYIIMSMQYVPRTDWVNDQCLIHMNYDMLEFTCAFHTFLDDFVSCLHVIKSFTFGFWEQGDFRLNHCLPFIIFKWCFCMLELNKILKIIFWKWKIPFYHRLIKIIWLQVRALYKGLVPKMMRLGPGK